MDRLSVLLQLDLPVGRMLRSTAGSGGFRRAEYGVAFDGHAVSLFHGAEAGGYAGFAGGDGLAVAAAVGVFGEVLAVAFYFAEVGAAVGRVLPRAGQAGDDGAQPRG